MSGNRTSQVSQLPTFVLGDKYKTAIGDSPEEKRVIEVTCPRRDCKKTFVVVIVDWWANHNNKKTRVSRPCPYCFKAAWRPKRK